MINKGMVARVIQKHKIVLVFFVLIVTLLPPLQPVKADAPLIYAVDNEKDFLLLVTFFSNSGSDDLVIYSKTGQVDDRIATFMHYFNRQVIFLSSNQVSKLVQSTSGQEAEIVLAEDAPAMSLVGSAIAARLRAPLFIGKITQTWNVPKGRVKIISVGKNLPSCDCDITSLETVDQALGFYNNLVGSSDTMILLDDAKNATIAAEEVILHKARLALDLNTAKAAHADYLIWVTSPIQITIENIKKLYLHQGKQAVYPENIGIITGFDLEDMSLLLARTFAYPDATGDWKTKTLNASLFDPDVDSQISTGTGTDIQLGGNLLTSDSFNRKVQTVGYAMVSAHGSSSGFQFHNGHWPDPIEPLVLPPLIFAAEACETANLTQSDLDNSVALRVLSSGAVAYIGSIDIGGIALIGDQPFLNSTKQTPLGELVRLENSARMDVDADYPRTVLFGDPTFHQIEQGNFSITPLMDSKATSPFIFRIDSQEKGNLAIAIEQNQPIVRARAILQDGKILNYTLGASHFGLPISAVQIQGGQKVLFEWPGGDGLIEFYPNWSISTWIQRALSDSISGLQAVLIDLTTSGGSPWYLTIMCAVLTIFMMKRYTRDRVLFALPVSAIVSSSITCLFWGLNIEVLLPVSLLIALWCFFSIAITSTKNSSFRKVGIPLLLFIAPFLLATILALRIGASTKVVWMIVEGIVLLSMIYILPLYTLSTLSKHTRLTKSCETV